jgi:drug/metabolite transporter (DMT)-like permease
MLTEFFNSMQSLPHLGEALSLVSALLWAFSVILFRIGGKNVHALGMNLFKNVLSLAFLFLTLIALGQPVWPALLWSHYVLFIASGIIGIAVSDTLFFLALNILGAELLAIVDCSYSPFVIGLSFLFIGERMDGRQSLGAILIVLAVFLITQKKSDALLPRKLLLTGIGLGVLSMFTTAAGIVMVKPLLGGISFLLASFIRMVGGTLSIAAFLSFHPKRKTILEPLVRLENIKILVPASVLGSYLSLVIWMGGMKYTQASVASAINQLNTIFIFILAAIFLKERITPLKLAAVIFAFAGAFLVSFPV